MCGIFFSYSQHRPSPTPNLLYDYLDRRGPDSSKILRREVRGDSSNSINKCTSHVIYLTFYASVLSLRGDQTIKQPLQDAVKGSILCWNGEIWNIDNQTVTGNDAETVFELLLRATDPYTPNGKKSSISDKKTLEDIVNVLRSFSGPASFLFFDAQNQRIFYGRDSLGRRSLLQKRDADGNISISSVRHPSDFDTWDEIEPGEIHMLDLKNQNNTDREIANILIIPKKLPFPRINKQILNTSDFVLDLGASVIDVLSQKLLASLSPRVRDIPIPPGVCENPPRIAILFSGGLDCALLARLVHSILPQGYEIDLLNAAFENPRVVKAAKSDKSQPLSSMFSAYAICPDRITGQSSHAELLRVCPGRVWRFVSIDVSYPETLAHRNEIISLIHPHKSEMDLSIACAFYFAARGTGTVLDHNNGKRFPYTAPARVLLSGLGADELFAGYNRHTTAYDRGGYQGLVDELELDFQRLGKRNLGRDDRVISHWGKEVRYPYLDEDLVRWVLGLPVWEKCGFGQVHPKKDDTAQIGAKYMDPEKKILRLLAWNLDMKGAAVEKKRAIQFGARTAKMEFGRIKGTQKLF